MRLSRNRDSLDAGMSLTLSDLRNGANIQTVLNAGETFPVVIFLAFYDAQGKMISLQNWNLSENMSFQTDELPQTLGVASVQMVLVGENFAPLAMLTVR